MTYILGGVTMKYRLEKIDHKKMGFELYQLIAEETFSVKTPYGVVVIEKNSKGGIVSGEDIVPQNDSSWVFDGCCVLGKDITLKNGVISNESEVYGSAEIVDTYIAYTLISNQDAFCGGKISESNIWFSSLKLFTGSFVRKSQITGVFLRGCFKISSTILNSPHKCIESDGERLKMLGNLRIINSEIDVTSPEVTAEKMALIVSPSDKNISLINAHIYTGDEIRVLNLSDEAPPICCYKLKKKSSKNQCWALTVSLNSGDVYKRKLNFDKIWDIFNLYRDFIDKKYLSQLNKDNIFKNFFSIFLSALVSVVGDEYREKIIQDKFFQATFIHVVMKMLTSNNKYLLNLFTISIKDKELKGYKDVVLLSTSLIARFCDTNKEFKYKHAQIISAIKEKNSGVLFNMLSSSASLF